MKLKTNLKTKSNIIEPVSFVGVIFLVILFFVISANYLGAPGIVMDMPNIEIEELYKLDSLIVAISGGKVFLYDKEINMDALREELIKRNPVLVAIKADKGAPYSEIAKIIDLAKQEGVKQIALAVGKDG